MKVSLILKGVPYDYQAEDLAEFIESSRIVPVATRVTESGDDTNNDGLPDPAHFGHPIYLISDSAVFDAEEMTQLIIKLGT